MPVIICNEVLRDHLPHWACSSMSFRCPFSDPHLIIFHSTIGVQIMAMLDVGMSTLQDLLIDSKLRPGYRCLENSVCGNPWVQGVYKPVIPEQSVLLDSVVHEIVISYETSHIFLIILQMLQLKSKCHVYFSNWDHLKFLRCFPILIRGCNSIWLFLVLLKLMFGFWAHYNF